MIINDNLHTNLAKLGLTSEESSVYLMLLSKGSLSAKAIAVEQNIVVNSIYRITRKLVNIELVTVLDTSPKHFQAVQPSESIARLINSKNKSLNELGEILIGQLSLKTNPSKLNMDLLSGRHSLFERFVDLAEQAKDDILVISIGEPVPDAIWTVTKASIVNGIKPKFIFQKYNKENIMLVKRWLTMGVAVRYLPEEGYHLNIFDRSAAILSASNPKQSKERTGVVIYNEPIIEMLRAYFFQQWSLARII